MVIRKLMIITIASFGSLAIRLDISFGIYILFNYTELALMMEKYKRVHC